MGLICDGSTASFWMWREGRIDASKLSFHWWLSLTWFLVRWTPAAQTMGHETLSLVLSVMVGCGESSGLHTPSPRIDGTNLARVI